MENFADECPYTLPEAKPLIHKEKGRLLEISKRPWIDRWWSWRDLNPRP